MMKNKIRILHVAQAAGGVDRYIRMLLKYLDKEKFENILVCSQDFHEEDYRDLVDSFEQVEMTRAIGSSDLKAIKEVRALIKKYNPDIVYADVHKFDNFVWYDASSDFEQVDDTTFIISTSASGILGIDYTYESGDNKADIYVDGELFESPAVRETSCCAVRAGCPARHILPA